MMEELFQSFFLEIAYLDHTTSSKFLLQMNFSFLGAQKFLLRICKYSKKSLIFLVLAFYFHHISIKYLHFEDLNVRFSSIRHEKYFVNIVHVNFNSDEGKK